MKKIILTLGIALICQLASAQDFAAAGQRAVTRYQTYDATLHFTDAQKDKIRDLINGIEEKQEYVQFDANLSAEQKTEYTQKNEESFQAIFYSMLTDNQKIVYNESLGEQD